MIYSLTLAALMITSFSSCSDDNDPVLTQKDWDGTTTYFASADAMKFDTYYKPSVGYVGDPMPFYDPQAKDFKIMYLQEYRPNQAGTYHPIWAVSTQDAASYTSMGELISCGGLSEQDAAIGTGSTIYNPSDKLYYTFYTGNKYQPTSSENGQVVMYATSAFRVEKACIFHLHLQKRRGRGNHSCCTRQCHPSDKKCDSWSRS